MGSQVWVVSTLLISIVLIVLTIVKFKFHPFLALLLASHYPDVDAVVAIVPDSAVFGEAVPLWTW